MTKYPANIDAVAAEIDQLLKEHELVLQEINGKIFLVNSRASLTRSEPHKRMRSKLENTPF